MRTNVRREPEPEPAPEPPRDLRAEAAAVLEHALALLSALEDDPHNERVLCELIVANARSSEIRAALEDNSAALRENGFAVRQAHAMGVADERARAARAAVPAMRPGRHASATAWRSGPLMRVVKVLLPVAVASLAAAKLIGKRAAPHSWMAAHPAAAAATVTGGVAMVALTAHLVTMTPPAPHSGAYAGPAPSAPAASAVAASLIPSSVPGTSPATRGKADVRGAGQLPAYISPAAYVAPTSASPSASATPSPAAGMLTVSTESVDLSSGQQVTVGLSANGGLVEWHAWCDPAGDVQLSVTSGTATPGTPSLLMLSVPPGEGSDTSAECHVWPGPIGINVLLPGPQPSVSPSGVPAPSGTPSPDPSSS